MRVTDDPCEVARDLIVAHRNRLEIGLDSVLEISLPLVTIGETVDLYHSGLSIDSLGDKQDIRRAEIFRPVLILKVLGLLSGEIESRRLALAQIEVSQRPAGQQQVSDHELNVLIRQHRLQRFILRFPQFSWQTHPHLRQSFDFSHGARLHFELF